jgi:hypothetical protein
MVCFCFFSEFIGGYDFGELFQPGSYINLSQADNAGLQDLMGKTSEFSLQKFIEHVVPCQHF